MNVEELLPAYAANELAEADRERVRAAVAESHGLREELARYEQLFVLLAAAAIEEQAVPADLSSRIIRQVTLQYYLNLATKLAYDLAGAYGRALVYYLRLA